MLARSLLLNVARSLQFISQSRLKPIAQFRVTALAVCESPGQILEHRWRFWVFADHRTNSFWSLSATHPACDCGRRGVRLFGLIAAAPFARILTAPTDVNSRAGRQRPSIERGGMEPKPGIGGQNVVGAYLLCASASMLLSVGMSAAPGTTLSPITKAGVPRMPRASASLRFFLICCANSGEAMSSLSLLISSPSDAATR